MFRALPAHPQEGLHKRHLVYCVRVMSVGCYQDWSGTAFDSSPVFKRTSCGRKVEDKYEDEGKRNNRNAHFGTVFISSAVHKVSQKSVDKKPTFRILTYKSKTQKINPCTGPEGSRRLRLSYFKTIVT
jgi:hypothetical protein